MKRHFICLCALMICFTQGYGQQYEKLAGTWKHEGRENYEQWTLENDGLTGYGYKVREGKEMITETLEIREVNGRINYLATVPDQNDGKTIAFELIEGDNDQLIFTNPAHDFPKKIIYRFVTTDRIQVTVLGKGEKGFEFFMERVK